jgi:hypothetical protein
MRQYRLKEILTNLRILEPFTLMRELPLRRKHRVWGTDIEEETLYHLKDCALDFAPPGGQKRANRQLVEIHGVALPLPGHRKRVKRILRWAFGFVRNADPSGGCNTATFGCEMLSHPACAIEGTHMSAKSTQLLRRKAGGVIGRLRAGTTVEEQFEAADGESLQSLGVSNRAKRTRIFRDFGKK